MFKQYLFFIYMSIVFFLNLLLFLPYTLSNISLRLNTTNVIVVKDAIDEDVASKFIYQLNSLQDKTNLYVYLDTPGGSVDSGNKILMEIQKYNMSCIADRAYSMGFVLLQGCKTRYILQYGKIMQHQISYAVQGEKGKIDSYNDFISQIEDELVTMQADKIGIDKNEFRLKTMNEWWSFGKYAKELKMVDDIIDVYCDDKLTKKNYTVSFGPFHAVYSKCPLIPTPIDTYIK